MLAKSFFGLVLLLAIGTNPHYRSIPSPEKSNASHLRAEVPSQRGEKVQAIEALKTAAIKHTSLSDYAQALECWIQVVMLTPQGSADEAAALEEIASLVKHPSTRSVPIANQLTEIGAKLLNLGRLHPADRLLTLAQHLYEDKVPNSLEVASCYVYLANLRIQQSELAEAGHFFEQALALRKMHEPNSLSVAGVHHGIARLRQELGDLVGAEGHIREALRINGKLAPESGELADDYKELGSILFDRGDHDGAERYYNEALQIRKRLGSHPLDLAALYVYLGTICISKSDDDGAEKHFAEALRIREEHVPESLDVANSYFDISGIARRKGDFVRAELLLRRSLSIRQKHAPESLPVAITHMGLSHLFVDKGDLRSAESELRRAIQIQETRAPGSLDLAKTYADLANLLLRQNEPREAVAVAQKGVSLLASRRSTFLTPEVRLAFAAGQADIVGPLLLAHLDSGNIAKAFESSNVLRGAALADVIESRSIDLLRNAAPEKQELLGRLQAEQSDIYRRLAEMTLNEEISKGGALRTRLKNISSQLKETREQIASANPRMPAIFASGSPVTVSEAASILDPGTLLLQYHVDHDRSVLFTLRRSASNAQPELRAYPIDISITKLKELCEAFRSRLANKLPFLESARELYNLLVKPADAEIAKGNRILICGQGPLNTLPFAALVTGNKSGQFFGDVKPLHQTVSLRTYEMLKKRRRLESKPLKRVAVFADPSYPQESNVATTMKTDSLRGLVTTRLPHTLAEADSIGKAFGKATKIYLRDRATVTSVLAEMPRAQVLHLACHGLLDPYDPLASGLALTPQKTDPGLLQAFRIARDLTLKADLVTLSACQTGLGKNTSNEGVQGLCSAFQYAGAKSVIVSLWNVSDRSTAPYMKEFYSRYARGQSKDEALRSAAIQLRKDPRYSHPFYWAPFVLIGDWK